MIHRTVVFSGLLAASSFLAGCGGDDAKTNTDTSGGAPGSGGEAAGGAPAATGGAGDAAGGAGLGGAGGVPAPEPIVAKMLIDGQDAPSGIAFADGRLFWANAGAGTIVSCDIGDCEGSLDVLVEDLDTPRGVALFEDTVYFTSVDGVQRCPAAGSCAAPEDVITGGNPPNFAVAVNGQRIVASFFPSDLVECPFEGCPDPEDRTLLESGGGIMDVKFVDTTIFFTRWGMQRIDQCEMGSNCSATFTTFHLPVTGATGVAVNATHVYFTETDFDAFSSTATEGTISRCPIDGCEDEPESVLTSAEVPFGLAVEPGVLYYTDFGDGSVHQEPL
jgi:hypothetical protein